MKDPTYFNKEQVQRAITLLRAAARIVSKSDEAKATTAFWDGTECDGMCLMDDIVVFLEEVCE